MKVYIVIGKNFGDEGKGLCTDYFAQKAENEGILCLVIKHNGGGQAGHTVDFPNKRFVFHQLSAGSFRHADTFWSDTYLPDLFKLSDERNAFESLSGIKPKIYASEYCRCVTVDDVLVNMLLEKTRGEKRHGSCGMGINEAVERSENPEFQLCIKEVAGSSVENLAKKLLAFREDYLPKRLEKLGIVAKNNKEYGELLNNNSVIYNAAERMMKNIEEVSILKENETKDFIRRYEEIIFEGAQGLLLDAEYIKYEPHLTSSRTGLTNPMKFLKRYTDGVKPEVIYVSRTYVTRHGAGPLPYENKSIPGTIINTDRTNIPNEWQGTLRLATHANFETFYQEAEQDYKAFNRMINISYMLTHCNETNEKVLFKDTSMLISEFKEKLLCQQLAEKIYISHSPFSEEIKDK